MAVKKVASSRAKRASTKQSRASSNPQEVEQLAYALYIQRGRVEGFDQQDWLEAERIVSQRRRAKTHTPKS